MRILLLAFSALFAPLVAPLVALAATARAEPPTAEAVVDAFEANLGPITTYRPSHPKGSCAAGHFTATPEGARLSVAPVFNGQRVPTIIRFGVGGANVRTPDTARSTRSLSVRFETPQGDIWDMANVSFPIFGAATPEALVAGLLARRPLAGGQPGPAAVAAFVAANPASLLQGRLIAATLPPASWATTPYFGINTFRFQGADGQLRPARWSFEPVAGTSRLTAEQLTTMPADFLADELRARVARAPAEFDMVLHFPAAGDDLNNPTVAWPEDRPRTVVGRLAVTSVQAGPGGPCDPISFMTLDQEPGIQLSDDPTLQARASSYAVSLSRRTR
ncbi:MAG: catalase family peroxidase [Rubritepida sp.]|nr:catalase family peroxidase [Rubritepida sp.]